MEKEKCILTTIRKIKLNHLHLHLRHAHHHLRLHLLHLLAVKKDGCLNSLAQALEQTPGDQLATVWKNHLSKSTIHHSPENAGEKDAQNKDCVSKAPYSYFLENIVEFSSQ